VKNIEIEKCLCPFDVSSEGESMVKYIEKVAEKYQVKKEAIFHKNTRK